MVVSAAPISTPLGIRGSRSGGRGGSRPRGRVSSSEARSTRAILVAGQLSNRKARSAVVGTTLRASMVSRPLTRGGRPLVRHPARWRNHRGTLAHAAQVLEGGDELLVLRRIRRDVGRRAALLLLVGVLEVAAQAGLALSLVLALELLRDLLEDDLVGVDALGLDRASGRREVARRGEPHRPVAAERDDGLHRALAERPRAEHRRALVVLQGTRDDLRGRGRAAVDQHDELLALGEVAGLGAEALRLFGVAAAGGDDLATLKEGVRD